jgi:hypothetical protein
MAEPRSRKLERLVRVQRQIERVAENDLAHTLRERAQNDEAREAMVDAMGSLDPVHRGMALHYSRRYAGLEGRARQLAGLQAVLEKRVLTEKTKADRLSEAAGEAAEREEREAVDESLLDLLDARISLEGSPSG